jgi:hypothetical protein
MSTLSWLTNAIITDKRHELDGKVLSRPALLVTDGKSIVYACDVDIGINDTTGYDQTLDLTNANIVGSILHNVPIAPGNDALIYADVGSAVRLRRSDSGRYEVIGFSLTMPGTNIRVPVNIDDLTFGPIEDRTLTSRPLTLGELSTYGTFGSIPFGAVALFRGTTLIGISA